MGTGFIQVTTLVVLSQKSSKEGNLRPFTSSQMTETRPSVVERTWAWLPHRPGPESDLCSHQPGTPSVFCPLCGEVNDPDPSPFTGLVVRMKCGDPRALGTSGRCLGTVPALPPIRYPAPDSQAVGWPAQCCRLSVGPGLESIPSPPQPPAAQGKFR